MEVEFFTLCLLIIALMGISVSIFLKVTFGGPALPGIFLSIVICGIVAIMVIPAMLEADNLNETCEIFGEVISSKKLNDNLIECTIYEKGKLETKYFELKKKVMWVEVNG